MTLDCDTPKRSGSTLRVPFGISQADGRLYEPRDVPLGAACGCICPGCNQPLYAKHCLGERVAPHFAHATGANCSAGYESALHRAAKQLIEEERHLRFPRLIAQLQVRDAMGRLYEPVKEVSPEGYFPLKEVTLEKTVQGIRPDLVVMVERVGPVLIEIAVTHFVDKTKLAKVAGLKVPLLEFDLSELRTATFDDLRAVLFSEPASGKWLFHPEVEAAKAQLRLDLQQILDDAAAEFAILTARQKELKLQYGQREKLNADRQRAHELRIEQERREAEYEEQLEVEQKERQRAQQERRERAARFQVRSDADKLKILLKAFGLTKLPTALYARVRGANSFGVSNPLIWQAAMFGGLIHLKPAAGLTLVKQDAARDWLREHFYITPETSDSVESAISDYLVELSKRGALNRLQDGFQIRVATVGSYEALRLLLLNQVSEENGLTWETEANWPSAVAAITVAKVHARTDNISGHWATLPALSPLVRTRLPREICDYYGRAGLNPAQVLEYLVCAGFLVVAGTSI